LAFKVGAIVSELQLKKDQWNQSIKKVKEDQKSLSGLVLRNSKSFATMGRAMTVAGGVIVGAVGLMVKAYANFDQAMTESLAIMGDVSDETRKKMSEVAKTISEETTYSAKELAEAYFFLASAGMDAEQSMSVLDDVARFAQAGTFDLATATDLLTDAQTALGLSSKNAAENEKNLIRVSDVLVGANTLANASVKQFAESLTNKAAAALVNVNKEVEEGVAVLAAYADKGIKGQLAGQRLTMMLNGLFDATRRNKKAWDEAGISLFKADGSMRDIADIIQDLEGYLGSMTVKQREAALAQLGFNLRTKDSILTLMGSSEKIRKWTEDLKNMGGKTREVSEKQLEAFNNQLKLLRNTVVNAAISIGESLAPTIEKLIVKVKDIAKKVSDWIKEHPKLTEWIGLTALKVGGLLLVLGPLLTILPGLIQGMNFLGISSAKAALGLKALLGPIGIVAAASLVAYNITKKLIDAKNDLVEADYRAFEAEHKMGQKLREIADAAGLTRKEFIELTKKYKGNTNALAVAIFRGEESVELQKAMKKYGKEHREEVVKGTTAIDKLAKAFMEGKISLEEYQEKLKALKKGHEDLNPALKTTIGLLEFTITPAIELARQFGEGKISIIEYTAGLQGLREEAERIKDPFKDLAQAESEVQIETEEMGDSWLVLGGIVPPIFHEQLSLAERLKQEIGDTTETITISFKSMVERILDFTRDLAAGWAGVFVDVLGITESITYQMKEFDNSYWESALANAQETYEEKKSLLEKQLEDATGYYEDLEGKLTDDYEKRKQWIEKNVTDEEKKQGMLLKLEQKHQADLEKARADQLQKEEDLQNQLVELEENHQTESERIRAEEDAAREQHAIDEEARQNSLWNKVKGIFGDAVENMLQSWTTDLIQGMLLGITDVAKSLVSDLGSAFTKVKTDAISTGSKVGSELGGIAGTIAGIGKGIASLITTLATAIAKAATTLAAAAPALAIVLGIALAAYAGFKLISSLFKKKPETGTMEAILKDISHIQLTALLDKMDESNFFASEMFPKIDYTNSILAKIENISKQIRNAVQAMVKKFGKFPSAQFGAVLTSPGLVETHGTPSNPEIIMRQNDLVNIPQAKGKVEVNLTVRNEFAFNNQVDPNFTRKYVLNEIIPIMYRGLEAGGKTKLKEILGVA